MGTISFILISLIRVISIMLISQTDKLSLGLLYDDEKGCAQAFVSGEREERGWKHSNCPRV